MKIRKIIINNFRNVTHAEYELGDLNIFTGANKQGKTNTILAVYWALTDFLFDGSSDFASFKPIGNESKTVSVELQFEDFSFKKSFEENWVKTRGTDERTMQGHVTSYEVNGAKYKTNKEALVEITKRLGLDDVKVSSKINLVRMLVDPYYLASGVDWKVLREFIIDLIGDVSNEDVLATNESFEVVKERLLQDKFNTDTSSKFFKQQIKTTKEEIESKESQIKGLDSMVDVQQSAAEEANNEIKELDKLIVSLQKDNSNDALISNINMRLADEKVKLSKSIDADRSNSDEFNKGINDQIESIQKSISIIEGSISSKNRERLNYEGILSNLYTEKNRLVLDLNNKSNERKRKLKEYEELDTSEYIPIEIPESIACPHCGCSINEEIINQYKMKNESNKKMFDSNKTTNLELIVKQGKELAAQIENVNLKINEVNTKDLDATNTIRLIKEEISILEEKKETELDKVRSLKKTLQMYEESNETKLLKIEVQKLEQELIQAKTQTTSTDILLKVSELQDKKKIHQAVLNEHIAYEQAQLKINKIRDDIAKKSNEQIELETKLILVQEFIQTKLKMFNDRIASVFGERIKFTLIENNIKEESWNEVCYPSVLDKDTPFINGSGSEQIQAGIYIVECVKQKLGLHDLLYIFDECEKLDSQSIKELGTQAQIITSKVDDSKYKEITLVKE